MVSFITPSLHRLITKVMGMEAERKVKVRISVLYDGVEFTVELGQWESEPEFVPIADMGGLVERVMRRVSELRQAWQQLMEGIQALRAEGFEVELADEDLSDLVPLRVTKKD